jgi:hypothetical protein
MILLLRLPGAPEHCNGCETTNHITLALEGGAELLISKALCRAEGPTSLPFRARLPYHLWNQPFHAGFDHASGYSANG